MSSLLRSAWAFFERVLPRLASAVLLLLLAAITSPQEVGLFNWATILYTAVMAVTDGAVRQIVLGAVSHPEGRLFLRRYRKVAMAASTVCLSAGFLGLYLYLPQGQKNNVVLLVPMMIGPILSIINISNLGLLQQGQQWRKLAAGQLLAAMASLLVAVPVILLSQSVLGCVLGLIIAEGTFVIWCRVNVRRMKLAADVKDRPLRETSFARSFRQMAIYSGLAWIQGQTDRILIGLLAGTAALGVFSLASALARSAGDALASSNTNLLRAEISALPGGVQSRAASRRRSKLIENNLVRGMGLAAATTISVSVVTALYIGPLLGDEWKPAIAIVPILALVAIPSSLSWSAAVLHISNNTGARAPLAPIVGVALAVPTAILATTSLPAAATLVVLREFALVLVAYGAIGRNAPWRCLAIAAVAVSLIAAAFYISGFIG